MASGNVASPGLAATLRELGHCWNRHDLAKAVSLHAPDYEGVDVGCGVVQCDPAAVGRCLAGYWEAFPDLRIAVEELVVEEDRVALAWRARGRHLGTFMNIPPTGRRVTVRGVSLLSVESGLVRRATHIWDVAAFLRAVRLLPDL